MQAASSLMRILDRVEDRLPALGLPLLSFRRRPPGSDDLHPVAGDLQTAHCGAATIPVAMEAIAGLAPDAGCAGEAQPAVLCCSVPIPLLAAYLLYLHIGP